LILKLINTCPSCGGELESIFDSELLMEDEPFVSPSYYKCENLKCAKVFLRSSETEEFYEP
jgi:hypothetical protein